MRRLLITVLTAACLAAAAASAAAAKQPLELRLWLDKASYSASEPIHASMALKNTGKQPVWVNARFYMSAPTGPGNGRDGHFIVTAPSGAELPCMVTVRAGFPKSDDFKRLEPGQEITMGSPRELRRFFDLKEPGTYVVRAVYQNAFGAELGLDAFKGPLESKPVMFTIIQ